MDQDIAELISRADAGDARAAEEMFTTLYRELHRLAERQLRRHGPALSLGTTTLLHEAYLQLADNAEARFVNHAHFMSYAARAMRWIVIDYSRRARALRRGGGADRIERRRGSSRIDAGGSRAARRRARRARRRRCTARAARRPAFLLRIQLRRDRGVSRRVRSNGAARLEKGANAPASGAARRPIVGRPTARSANTSFPLSESRRERRRPCTCCSAAPRAGRRSRR